MHVRGGEGRSSSAASTEVEEDAEALATKRDKDFMGEEVEKSDNGSHHIFDIYIFGVTTIHLHIIMRV